MRAEMIGSKKSAATKNYLRVNTSLPRWVRYMNDSLISCRCAAQTDGIVLPAPMELISATLRRRRRVSATGVLVISLFACRASPSPGAPAQTQERTAVASCDLFEISGPTVIAYFDYANLQSDPNFSDTFGDFQFSVQGMRERLDQAVVRVHECHRSFELQVRGKRQRFDIEPKGAGYYLISPDKAAHVERGVITDDDLIEVMKQYFGSQVMNRALIVSK